MQAIRVIVLSCVAGCLVPVERLLAMPFYAAPGGGAPFGAPRWAARPLLGPLMLCATAAAAPGERGSSRKRQQPQAA